VEQLRNGKPGPHETWEELAEHSLLHDDVGSPVVLAAAAGTLRIEVDGAMAVLMDGDVPLPRSVQRGERGWS
jgi:hypothetical protein